VLDETCTDKQITALAHLSQSRCEDIKVPSQRNEPPETRAIERNAYARTLGQCDVRNDLAERNSTDVMCEIEALGRECWYINMGAVNESFFTTDAMRAATPCRTARRVDMESPGRMWVPERRHGKHLDRLAVRFMAKTLASWRKITQ